MVWPLTKAQNSRPQSGGISQNTGVATNQYLKILDSSLEGDLHKT